MKHIILAIVFFIAVASVAGQVLTAKDDISAEKYFAAEKRGEELLKAANYRSVWTKEYFADRSKEPKLEEKKVKEVVQPNKWRSVKERFGVRPRREEIISDGKAFYFRTNDGAWEKGGLGNSSGYEIFGGTITNQYRYSPSVDLEGKTAELYELVAIRNPQPSSRNALFGIRYVQTIRIWYSSEGKFLKKTEETAIETRSPVLIETTTYEYDPKDLKIEAPKMN